MHTINTSASNIEPFIPDQQHSSSANVTISNENQTIVPNRVKPMFAGQRQTLHNKNRNHERGSKGEDASKPTSYGQKKYHGTQAAAKQSENLIDSHNLLSNSIEEMPNPLEFHHSIARQQALNVLKSDQASSQRSQMRNNVTQSITHDSSQNLNQVQSRSMKQG